MTSMTVPSSACACANCPGAGCRCGCQDNRPAGATPAACVCGPACGCDGPEQGCVCQ